MSARDIYLNKFNRRARFKRDATTSSSRAPAGAYTPVAPAYTPVAPAYTPAGAYTPVASAYTPVKPNTGADIYPFISVHPGSPQITELYVSGVIPLTTTTPITRLRAAELLSLQKTLKKAIADGAEEFTIDGVTVSRARARELLDTPLIELCEKFYGLYTIEL